MGCLTNLGGCGSVAMSSEDLEAGTRVPAPAWIVASLEVNEGRDPLGLQTTTQDRLMPVLLPGVLELSRRARYFSCHAFLLAEYQARRFQPDSKSLSAFIKHREWEFGLAVQRCPRGCGSSPVGARKLGSVSLGWGPFPRGESVESAFGGYGLYYRSPMAELGIVARSGTLLGDQPIPIDVLYDTDRARRLAATFKAAVEGTVYYQRAMWTNDDLPADVIEEYAEVACLCQLRERPEERDAVHDALFGMDPADSRPTATLTFDEEVPIQDDQAPVAGFSEAGVVQRRRSVGHYLTLVGADARVVDSEGIYRELLWSPPTPRSDGHALVGGQWAALIAKDVWQEALCSVWSEFCRSGLAHSRDLGRGLTWDETREVAASLVAGPPNLEAATPTAELASRLAAGTLTIPDTAGADVNVAAAPLESLRRLTDEVDTASSGLVVLLELAHRMQDRSGAGWEQASHIASAWQPSVAAVATGLRTHLADAPAVADTLWWLLSRFIIPVHERIAYSKLPEFTFRFRWEDGLLRFYDHGIGRFPLAAIRHQPLASLTWDLGLWDDPDETSPATLTERGVRFLGEALA
jgi:hypothetical protein